MHTWSPRLITTSKFSYLHFRHAELNSVEISLSDLGSQFQVAVDAPRLPQIDVVGRFNASPGTNTPRFGRVFDFGQDWSFNVGRHEWKWGFQILRNYYQITNDQAASGRFTFDGTVSRNPVADFLLGRSSRFLQNSQLVQGGGNWIPAFYLQDSWRVSPRLTLNLGFRWEIYTAYNDDLGQQASYIQGVQSRTFPTAPLGVVFEDDPEFNYRTDWVNPSPRVGFAYDVTGDGKTALRGGYAVTFDGIIAQHRLGANQPFSLNVEVFNPGPLVNPYANVPNPFPYIVNPANAVFTTPLILDTSVAGDKLESMYNHNVNLTLERQLLRDLMVQASYIGNFGRKLYSVREYNPAVYRPGATTANTQQRRLLGPNFGGFRGFSSDGTSSYNAMQVLAQKRMSRGFTVVGHYTWSRAIDDACSTEALTGCRQQDPYNRTGSRGPSDFDRTHVAVISYVWDLPYASGRSFIRQVGGGWQLAGVNRFQTGTPFTVFTGRDASLTAVNADRPDVFGNPTLSGDRSRGDKIARWFDTSVFMANQPGTYGSLGRNALRGPGSWEWDLSIQKAFAVVETHRLEFRADLFNVLNHANLSNPQDTMTAPQSFGRITGTSGPRQIQLALRYEF